MKHKHEKGKLSTITVDGSNIDWSQLQLGTCWSWPNRKSSRPKEFIGYITKADYKTGTITLSDKPKKLRKRVK